MEKYTVSKLESRVYSLSCPHKGELKTFIRENGEIKIKFPFMLKGPEVMKALTFPFTDGYVLRDYSGYVRVGYVNSNLKMHREIIRCVRSTFGDVDYSQRRVRNAYETYFAGILGKIYVESLGFVPKNKLETNVHLHEILMKSKNPAEIGASLSQIMDDEGSFNRMTFYIGISGGEVPRGKVDKVLDNFRSYDVQRKFMPNILKDVKSMLEKVNISSRVKTPVRYVDHTEGSTKLMWYLTIQGPSSLLKINSICTFKNENLRMKFTRYIKHRTKVVKILRNIENEKGFLTVNFVKEALDIPMRSARNIIRVLKRDKIVGMFEEGKYQYLSDSKKLKYQQAKFKFISPSMGKGIF